ncbi:MAG: hypothetical protein NTW66_02880 [Candidatus Magasanikbacteria bacterium]|nr:hypothetical protein [Candidatus Magasanikbacteria bacterium]
MNSQNRQRNSFVALCDYASRSNWCWNIVCTTCGHGAFKVSYAKIINGQNPDDESFWPYGKENDDSLKEMNVNRVFLGDASADAQIKLASVVAKAKLSDIQSVAKFPDWLGYIGLVIHHCPNQEARKIISDSFLSQFIELLKDKAGIREYLSQKQAKQELLDINDLSRIENEIVNH